MPGNRQFTSYDYRRECLMGLTTLPLIGPLRLPVPRELRRRHVYFGIVWMGFSDFDARADMNFLDGADTVLRLHQRWSTQFTTNGASSAGWGGSGQTWRSTTPGFPSYSVDQWGPPGNQPNWGQQSGASDIMTVQGVQRPDGVNLEAYRLTMFPFEFLGPLEEIQIQFRGFTPGTFEADPTIEVYLGCKSFTQ